MITRTYECNRAAKWRCPINELKCNLYHFGTRVALAVAGPGVQGGRVVDDFTCLPDLAPTFLEAGKLAIPDEMTARSLWS
jgi:arylsulfatase A-like enzyme